MFTTDILLAARTDYLDDIVIPYKWSDVELLRHLNKALNEWCRETGCIRDTTTSAICKTLLLANQHTYALDPRITEIHTPCNIINYDSVLEQYTTKKVEVISDSYVDDMMTGWRTAYGGTGYLIPDYDYGHFRIVRYGSPDDGYWTGAFTFTGGTTKSIFQTGATFSDLLEVGDQVWMTGTVSNGTTAVPKTFTVVTVSTTSFTVSETITDETVASGGIMQKVIDTLWLTVSRLPLADLTIAGIATESPEIASQYHIYLIDGILRDAYMKQDSQCYNKQLAMEHRGLFETSKRKGKATRDWLRNSNETARPRLGTL